MANSNLMLNGSHIVYISVCSPCITADNIKIHITTIFDPQLLKMDNWNSQLFKHQCIE